MPPEPTIRVSYSIIVRFVAEEAMDAAGGLFRERMEKRIRSLQKDPKPPDVKSEQVGDDISFILSVDDVDPPSYLSYSIDENKNPAVVVVTGISRKRYGDTT